MLRSFKYVNKKFTPSIEQPPENYVYLDTGAYVFEGLRTHKRGYWVKSHCIKLKEIYKDMSYLDRSPKHTGMYMTLRMKVDTYNDPK